jgi:hypothetical protein
MVRPGLRGPTAAVSIRGLQEASMKGASLEVSDEPAAVPASTGRRWMSRWMLLPAFSLLGESLPRKTTQHPVQQVVRALKAQRPPTHRLITPTVGVTQMHISPARLRERSSDEQDCTQTSPSSCTLCRTIQRAKAGTGQVQHARLARRRPFNGKCQIAIASSLQRCAWCY